LLTANDQCTGGTCSGNTFECPCDFPDGLNALFANTSTDIACWSIPGAALVVLETGVSSGQNLAIVEFTSTFNIPETTAPSCGLTDYIGGLNINQHLNCLAKLSEWGETNCTVNW
jgi:hypothetical protein